MNCYVGIDIGTTNCKALIANEEGIVIQEASVSTPYEKFKNLSFFDLKGIDAFVDHVEEIASGLGTLRSMGFSSIGESTIPVDKDGKALFDPPLWSELSITTTKEEAEIIQKENSFQSIGISQNGLLSLDKILWFKRNYPEIAKKAVHYLPMTSYQVLRKTGNAVWDYSQCIRSNAFLVHEKKWNEKLLGRFGLQSFGDIKPMGYSCGKKDNVVYGLGGHDHITGLYGIYSLLHDKEPSFFYESMGTSAVLTMVVGKDEKDFPILKTYNPPEGSFLPGFDDHSFVMTRSFRSFGKLNAMWLNIKGEKPNRDVFDAINRQITSRPFKGLSFLMECDSDFIRGNTKDGVLNLYRFDPEADLADCMQSTYLYLAVGALELEKTLRSVVGFTQPLPYMAGGAVCKDPLFMTLRATALGHDIMSLKTKEISALGALFVGLHAASEGEAMQALKEQTLAHTICHHPDERYRQRINEAIDAYASLKEKLDKGERI